MIKCFFLLAILMLMGTLTKSQTIVVALGPSIISKVNYTAAGTPTLAPFNSVNDLENGLITDAVTFSIKSNRLWKLATSITDIVGTSIAGGASTITAPLLPMNIFWGVINGADGTVTSWTAFANATNTTAASIIVKTGPRGAPDVNGNTFTFRYKVVPGFTVDPGTYAVDVTYTVSAQ